MGPKIVVAETVESLKKQIETFMFGIVKKALQEKGNALIGVSGGSMPKIVAPLIKAEKSIDWSAVKFFVVDERMVELSDEESNTGNYLRLLPEAFKNSFIEYGPIDDLPKCAKNYADSLLKLKPVMCNGWPQFDLLLLGHGPDGHTCSLFPSHRLLNNKTDIVAYIEDSPKPPPKRITLTLPVLNNACHVAFISTGESKADILKSILDDQDQNLPSVLVRPVSGSVCWFLDAGAASKLKKK